MKTEWFFGHFQLVWLNHYLKDPLSRGEVKLPARLPKSLNVKVLWIQFLFTSDQLEWTLCVFALGNSANIFASDLGLFKYPGGVRIECRVIAVTLLAGWLFD